MTRPGQVGLFQQENEHDGHPLRDGHGHGVGHPYRRCSRKMGELETLPIPQPAKMPAAQAGSGVPKPVIVTIKRHRHYVIPTASVDDNTSASGNTGQAGNKVSGSPAPSVLFSRVAPK